MAEFSRREHLKGLLGLTAAAALPGCASQQVASTEPVPPQGIGHRIKHISYRDQGGRPDLFVMPDGLMYVTDWNAGLNVLQYEG